MEMRKLKEKKNTQKWETTIKWKGEKRLTNGITKKWSFELCCLSILSENEIKKEEAEFAADSLSGGKGGIVYISLWERAHKKKMG